MKTRIPLPVATRLTADHAPQRRAAGAHTTTPLQQMADRSGRVGLLQRLQADADGCVQRAGAEEEEALQARFERVTGGSEPLLRRVDPTTTVNGVPVNDDPGLEHEADVMGAKAAQFVPLFSDASVQGPFGNISVLAAQRMREVEEAASTSDPEIEAKAIEKSNSATHQGHMEQGGKIKNPKDFEPKRQAQIFSKMQTQKGDRAKKQLEAEQKRKKPDEEKIAQLMLETSVSRQPESSVKLNNTGLPDNLKAGIEHYSGASLDGVTVHYNSAKPAQLNALAYAQGTDIHLAPGQEQHLPHEAWHVVQQAQRSIGTIMPMKVAVPANNDPVREHEAKLIGRHTARGSARLAPQRPSSGIAGDLAVGAAQLRSVVQRTQCGECLKFNGHEKWCSHYKPPKASHSGKGTHKRGLNHDDGTGFTRSGSGAEKHDHGLHVQAVIRRNKERFGKKK